MPRANFSCARCTKLLTATVEIVHEDLPVESKVCPLCGARRGFRRLYDGVNVSTKGHRIAKVLDPMMKPQFDAMDRNKNSLAESEARIAAMSKQVETLSREMRGLTEQQRAAVVDIEAQRRPQWKGAKAALAAADPGARYDSRNFIYPHIRRRVVPLRP